MYESGPWASLQRTKAGDAVQPLLHLVAVHELKLNEHSKMGNRFSQRTNSSVVGAYRIDQRLRLDTKKCSYAKEFD